MSTLGLTASQLTVKLNPKRPRAKWILFGDVHKGSHSCDEKSFSKLQENILTLAEKDIVLVTGMGDLLDSILPKDKRFSVMEHKAYFTQSQRELVDWFKGLKKNKNVKFNGALYGNHEAVLLDDGIQAYEPLNELGIESCGYRNHNLIHFEFGKHRETIRSVLGHELAGKSLQSFLNFANEARFQRRIDGAIVPVKIFARGHTHALSTYSRCFSIDAPEEETEYNVTQFLCDTGSFLTQAYGKSSYAVKKGMAKQTVGYVEVDIDFEREDKVEVTTRFNGHLNAQKTLHIKGEV